MDRDATPPRKRTGRRPGKPDTRGEILAAAQAVFLRDGFHGASLRGIAREAGVDPALIHRLFGDKRALLLATVRAGFDPLDLIDRLVAGGPDHLGVRILMSATGVWESRMGRAWVEAVSRTPGLVAVMVGYLNDPITEAGKRLLGFSEAEARLRVGVMESLMVGLVTTRYVVRLEPIASLPREELARVYAPMLQHAISGDLGPTLTRAQQRQP